ncbi:MAG: twin-arginine translocase subunit TatB [Proteobacteria bacterium]|nr:twin-arginine translocase subunit TatB [Pseudomonadota bacterium]
MFDFSFGEISLLAVVALLVLGPERLPRVARTAGALVRRARNGWQSVRDEIERELQAEELKRGIEEAKRAAADLHNDIRTASNDIQTSVEHVAQDVHMQAEPSSAGPSAEASLIQATLSPAPPDAPNHELH